MCGIAGIASDRDAGTIDIAARMREMRNRLVHRGPDSAGEHAGPGIALGVRRLRVIDLATGDQPQSNEDGTVWTVFNGEIYNFKELRRSLEARGHRLVTASDTEVIPHLYEDHGVGFVEHLEGMFALAVWDAARRTLVLARDRMGEKPLLYSERDGSIVFASEHEALLCGLGAVPPVDEHAIRLYLHVGYVPAPHDAFAGVHKLPPAHALVWREGESQVHRYWRPPEPGSRPLVAAEAAQAVRETITQAIRARLVADVPLGAFLSGGIDSSVLVATMATLARDVRTFTIGFDEPAFSELHHARRVAERFRTSHHELVVRPLQIDLLPDLVRRYGEPFADSSCLPTFYVSRLARADVTVALSGDGGDELFAGYDRYRAARLSATLDRVVPRSGRSALARIAGALPTRSDGRTAVGRVARFLRATADPPGARYLRWQSVFEPDQLEAMLEPSFADRTRTAASELDAGAVFAALDPVAAAQSVDVGRYLPDDLLTKVDIASMAVSLEVRAPFLAQAVVELAIGLQTDLKLRGRRSKHLLREAFADLLPAETLARRKQGFGVPVAAWFRGPLRNHARERLATPDAAVRRYLAPPAIERLLREHTDGRADHGPRIWALLMLETWHREVARA